MCNLLSLSLSLSSLSLSLSSLSLLSLLSLSLLSLFSHSRLLPLPLVKGSLLSLVHPMAASVTHDTCERPGERRPRRLRLSLRTLLLPRLTTLLITTTTLGGGNGTVYCLTADTPTLPLISIVSGSRRSRLMPFSYGTCLGGWRRGGEWKGGRGERGGRGRRRKNRRRGGLREGREAGREVILPHHQHHQHYQHQHQQQHQQHHQQ